MRILLVCDSLLEKGSLEQTLLDRGHTVIANIRPSDNVPVFAQASRPGAIVVYVKRQTRPLFSQLEKLGELHPCPVVVFAGKSSDDFARHSVKAGISAYVVDGFSPERLKTILDIAVARFEERKGLKDELSRARGALSDRKSVERAKNILIVKKGLTEEEAYQTLRGMALRQNMKLAQIARNIITAAEVLVS